MSLRDIGRTEILTLERFDQLLDYDAESGIFRRKVSAGGHSAGEVAGYLDAVGYRLIKVDGRAYRAHRLAFLAMTGEFPPGEVDHANRVTDDNRWANLRNCDRIGNNQNKGGYSSNSVGIPGVTKRKKCGRYVAQIQVRGKRKHLGLFDTPEAAGEAYLRAKEKLHEASKWRT